MQISQQTFQEELSNKGNFEFLIFLPLKWMLKIGKFNNYYKHLIFDLF